MQIYTNILLFLLYLYIYIKYNALYIRDNFVYTYICIDWVLALVEQAQYQPSKKTQWRQRDNR